MDKTRKTRIRQGVFSALFTLTLAGGLVITISGGLEDDSKGGFAPANPDYLSWLHQVQLQPDMPQLSAEGYALGHIPSQVDPYLYDTGETIDSAEVDDLPAKYDLRTLNKLTPVRNQGNCGSCWAFATHAALESSIRPGASYNFSEQHLIKNHGFKYGPCDGGNLLIALAYLSRWTGPVNESDVPYTHLAADEAASVKKHVQNVIFAPVKKNHGDNSKIKKLLMKYGAVYSNMYYDGVCFNAANNAFYNPDSKVGGHAVSIVGWDDSFSRNNFNQIPPKDGAFIVRNSWGPGWGENGYFYVSYCDMYLGRRWYSAAVKKAETPANYKKVYSYDISGWVQNFGWGRNVGWMANMFTAGSSESVQAVSFYACGSSSNYAVYVYRGCTVGQPRSGVFVTKKSGKLSAPGYYTIKLNKKVAVSMGQRFSVVVKLITTGSDYPIPCEVRTKGYTKVKYSKSSKNQSFLSPNGTDWTDLIEEAKNANVCLKAFVK